MFFALLQLVRTNRNLSKMSIRDLSALQLNNTTPALDDQLQWAINESIKTAREQHAAGAHTGEALQRAIDDEAIDDEALRRAIDASITTAREQDAEKVPTYGEELRQTAIKFSRQQGADLEAARRQCNLLAGELAAERRKNSLLTEELAAALKGNNRIVIELPLAHKPNPPSATEIIDILALAARDLSPPANVTTPLPDTDQPSAEELYWPFYDI
jgi:hypothetical protein